MGKWSGEPILLWPIRITMGLVRSFSPTISIDPWPQQTSHLVPNEFTNTNTEVLLQCPVNECARIATTIGTKAHTLA